MITLGISWSTAGIAFGIGSAMLAGLFFLKPRRRERPVPSVMLFAAAMPRTKQRVLFRRPAEMLHFLLLLSMFAAAIAALTEPVQSTDGAHFTVIATAPEAQKEAERFTKKLNPLDVQIVSTKIAGVSDRSGALWSAMQQVNPAAENRERQIVFFAPDAPPWLPENGSWIASGIQERNAEETKSPSIPKFQLYFEDEPETPPRFRLPSNMKQATHAAGADALVHSVPTEPEQWGALFHKLRSRRGAYTDQFQHEEITPLTDWHTIAEKSGGTLRISTWLWLLALILFVVDGWLYARGKVV